MDSLVAKSDFPILSRRENGKAIAYLDNASTTQKPSSVLDAERSFYEKSNANVHRAAYALSEEATEKYEAARKRIGNFVNAPAESIVFTRNATEALNLSAYSLASFLQKGDEVVSTVQEHHSSLVPWQQIAPWRGAKVRYADITSEGELDVDGLLAMMHERTAVVALSHASNILGNSVDVKKIVKKAKECNALVVLDAAQSVPHSPVDFSALGVDLMAFTGHKMLGPLGIGVLVGKKELLHKMPPFQYGGDMIREVALEKTTFADVPAKFEAGTHNYAGAVALSAAMDYLEKAGMSKLYAHEKALAKELVDELASLNGVSLYGPPASRRAGIVSFNVKEAHAHDVATILDREGVCVRSGHGCAMPLMMRLGVPAVVRASFYAYNDSSDVQRLVSGVKKAQKVFA